MANTLVLIRVQASGGKFLADDIGGAEVTIRDARTGRWLDGGLVQGKDSGTLLANYVTTASRSVIVTPGISPNPPKVQWLVPDLVPRTPTSHFLAQLELTQPTLLEIEVYGPLGGLQSAQRVVTHTWAVPGQSITQGPGFVVELPGLVVQVQEPSTHAEFSGAPGKVGFRANVTMMCGCPIGTGLPWIPDDFKVTAIVQQIGSAAAPVSVDMPLISNPSTFFGSSDFNTVGFYRATVTAVQKSTGNIGTGTVTFFSKP